MIVASSINNKIVPNAPQTKNSGCICSFPEPVGEFRQYIPCIFMLCLKNLFYIINYHKNTEKNQTSCLQNLLLTFWQKLLRGSHTKQKIRMEIIYIQYSIRIIYIQYIKYYMVLRRETKPLGVVKCSAMMSPSCNKLFVFS